MTESIARRAKRIVSGSINALMDAAEGISPEIVMKESIRELESVITQIRQEMGRLVVEKERLAKQMDELKAKHTTLQEQMTLALKEAREDLATAAASRQINIEEQLPTLNESRGDLEAAIAKYEEYIKALQAKKREMQEELQSFAQRTAAVAETEISHSVSAAQQAFERVMGGSSSDLELTEERKLAELEELARNNRIKEKLEAIRSRLHD